MFSGGQYCHDGLDYPASGEAVLTSGPGAGRCRCRCDGCLRHPDPLFLHDPLQPDELSLLQSGEKDAAGDDLSETAAAGSLLQPAGADFGGGAGGRGGCGSAGDLFRSVSAPVFLRHAGAVDAVCRSVLCQCPICGGTASVCAPDPRGYRCRSDLGQEAPVQILGAVYRPWRHLPGKPPGPDHAENLSGG